MVSGNFGCMPFKVCEVKVIWKCLLFTWESEKKKINKAENVLVELKSISYANFSRELKWLALENSFVILICDVYLSSANDNLKEAGAFLQESRKLNLNMEINAITTVHEKKRKSIMAEKLG